MKNIFNFKFYFILVVLISLLILTKIDISQIVHNSIYKTKHLFSNELKQSIKNVISKAIEENSYYSKSIVIKLMTNTAKKKFSNRNILEIRNLILNDYILDPEQITYFEKPELVESIKFNTYPDKNSKIMGVNFYKINNYCIIEYSKYHSNNKKKLLIYNQGHAGNPYNFDYFINIKEHYKQKGFDVMSLSMSNLGYNEEPINFPLFDLERDLKLTRESKKHSAYVGPSAFAHRDHHDVYYTFYDERYPNKKPLSLMLSGNYYLIKKILSDSAYKEVYMIGISGGAWYTTILSSIIPEIKTSYTFAGPYPLFLQLFWYNRGDWEIYDSKIYEKIDYWDLYLLSTIDKFNKQNRKHFKIFYKFAFGSASDHHSALIMKAVSDNIESPNFKIELHDTNPHIIDGNFLFSQF